MGRHRFPIARLVGLQGCFCLSIFAFHAEAHARPKVQRPVEIIWFDDVCHGASAFSSALLMKVPALRLSVVSWPTLRIEATIERLGEKLEGQLAIHDDGITTHRNLSGRNCTEVIESMALVSSLVLDSSGESESSSPREVTSSTLPTPREAADIPPPLPPVEASAPQSRWGLDVGVGVASIGSLGAVVETPLTIAFERRQSFYFGLSLSPSIPVRIDANPGGADFTFWRARLDACPFSLLRTGPFDLLPCIAIDGGLLHAASTGVVFARSTDRPWFTAHAGARFSMAIGTTSTLALDLDAAFPLRRDEFAFDTGTTLFLAPVVYANARISAG